MADVEYRRAALVATARDLLGLVAGWFPGSARADTPSHFVWASGFLARCHGLLSGVTTLVEQHEDDSVAALYRPLLETYLAGMYVLLGGDEAEAALRAGQLHDAYQVELALGREPVRPEGAEKLKVSDYKQGTGLVDRVDELLSSVDPASAGWARTAYATQYSTTSYHDSHGGLGVLEGHVSDLHDGGASVTLRRGRPAVALRLLDMGVSLMFSFAAVWADRAGKDDTDLRAVHARWQQLARPDRPPGSDGADG
jgi:hypothetical protein